MKIEELATLLKRPADAPAPEVPITRPDRLIGPVPFSICFPHTSRRSQRELDTQEALDRALEGMDRESRFDALVYNVTSKRFVRRSVDAHLGAVEL